MQKYNSKNLFKIMFPNRKSVSLFIRIKKRFTQVVNFILNIFKEIFLLRLIINKPLKKNNKKNILIIIDGNRILGHSSCPTTQRLLKLKDTSEINFYFINDPLSKLSNNKLKMIYSFSKLLLFKLIQSGSLISSFRNFWKEIFKKFNPDLIIGLMPNPILVEAANENNVKIADIQHGLITLDHEWYMDRFHYVESIFYKFKPSHLLLWSIREVNVIREMILTSKNNIEKSELIIIGPNVNYDKTNQIAKKNSLNNILITCSYGHKGFYTENEFKQIDSYCLTTKELFLWMLKIKNYIIRFRLHPIAYKNKDSLKQIKGIKYLAEVNNQSSFNLSKNNSLSDDLNWSDIHITLNSSCSIDAYFLNKVTLFLCPASKRWFKSSFNDLDGYVFKRENYDSFSELFKNAISFQRKVRISPRNLSDSLLEKINKIVL